MKKKLLLPIAILIAGHYTAKAQVKNITTYKKMPSARINPAVTEAKLKNQETKPKYSKYKIQPVKRLNISSLVTMKKDFYTMRDGDYSIISMKLPGNTAKKDYYVKKWGTKLILNGDIIVHDFSVTTTKSLTRDDEYPIFGRNELYRWPGGTVPVVLDNSVFEGDNYLIIKSALDYFNFNTGIIFKERTNEDEWLYIKVINPDGSGAGGRSAVGRQRNGSNVLELIKGKFGKGTVLHELMHTLGVYHEQGRGDRDYYIDIHWDNIRDDAKNNFQVESDATARGYYDYCSIMQYPSVSFSKTMGVATITCKTNGAPSSCPSCMGQRSTLSKMDIDGLDEYYRGIGISRFPSGIPFTYSKIPVAGCIGVADQQIKNKWVQYKVALGNCQTGVIGMGIFNATYVQFERGVIYHTPKGVFVIYGFIYQLFNAQNGIGKMGFPISDEEDIPQNNTNFRNKGYTRISRFEKGVIIWGPNKKATYLTNKQFKMTTIKVIKMNRPDNNIRLIEKAKLQPVHH